MIKYLKYMFVAAIAMIAVASCQEDIEESFAIKPTAPVLNDNGTILMTENTISEKIVWTWKAARFLKGEVTYTLYTQYGEEAATQVGAATKDLNITMSKADFRTLLDGINSLPENATFDMAFYLVASDEEAKYESEKKLMKVYSYGNAVSSEITAEQTEVVLDITNPTEPLTLLTWTDARLVYGEAITYGVYVSYPNNEERADNPEPIEVAKDLTETSCTKTVDEWNELAIDAGAPESAACDLQFIVKAFSESYPEGVPSAPVIINVTTYTATYPDYLYVPGSHQGWKPESAIGIAHSTLTKGLFECYMDLSTTDGADVEFKFNPDKGWANNDFGIDGEAEIVTDAEKNVVVTAKLGGENKNVKVPSGLYRISVNRKLNTLEMVKIVSMGVIGNATPKGWDAETPMIYDAESNTYSLVTKMTAGSYKFRANNNWTYSIGNDGTFSGGDYTMDKADGEYKIVLDVNRHPYTVKLLSTEFPDRLYVPGSHQNWDPKVASCPTLEGNGEGVYEGGVNLATDGNCEFKFSPVNDWVGDFGGTITIDKEGYGKGSYGAKENISVPGGYYYIKVDMTEGTLEMQRINKVGITGDFNSWGADVEFAYDATNDVWKVKQALTTTQEFKIRMNGGWSVNRGIPVKGVVPTGSATAVYNDGENMKVGADGTYTITLDMSTNPNTILIVK